VAAPARHADLHHVAPRVVETERAFRRHHGPAVVRQVPDHWISVASTDQEVKVSDRRVSGGEDAKAAAPRCDIHSVELCRVVFRLVAEEGSSERAHSAQRAAAARESGEVGAGVAGGHESDVAVSPRVRRRHGRRVARDRRGATGAKHEEQRESPHARSVGVPGATRPAGACLAVVGRRESAPPMRPSGMYLGSVLLVLSGTSLAQPSVGRRVQLDYQAPATCPSAGVFERELWSRLSPEGARATADRSLRVRVFQDVMGFRGTVQVAESSDGASQRELGSANCAELVRALALVTAVVLNPSAIVEPGPTAPAESPASSVAASSAAPSPIETKTTAAPAPERSQRSYRGGRWVFVGGTAASLETLVPSHPLLLPRIAVGAEYLSTLWGAGIRLSGTRADSGQIKKAVGNVDLVWTVGRLEVCLVSRPVPWLTVSPCGLVDAGELRGTSSSTSAARRWVAPGGLGRAEARLVGPLWVAAELGATRPLVRTEFYIRRAGQSDITLFKVPSAVLTAGLGLIVRWP
jgi:hypothetical protein